MPANSFIDQPPSPEVIADLVHRFDQLLRVERLDDEAVDVHSEQTVHHRLRAVAGDRDNRNGLGPDVVPQLPNEARSAHTGHVDVCQNDINTRNHVDSFQAVVRLDENIRASAFQRLNDQRPHLVVVVHDQDFHRFSLRRPCPTVSSKVAVKEGIIK